MKISDNRIVDVAQNNAAAFASAYKVGMQLVGAFNDLRINRNEIIDTRGTAVMAAGIDVQFVTAVTSGEIIDNTLRWADGASVAPDLIFATSSSAAFYVRHRAAHYSTPTRPTRGGSTIVDTSTGTTYYQTTGPTGTTWATTPTSLLGAMSHIPRANYYSTTFGAHSTIVGTTANGVAYATPLLLGAPGTVTRIACEVTSAGSAGALVRLGIYADDGTGAPGALLADGGTIDGTSATFQEVTLGTPLALSAGRYWLAAAFQGAPTTGPTMRAAAGTAVVAAGSTSGAFGSPTAAGWTMTGVTGALPTPWVISTTSGVPILVGVRWQ
jgi:hypothetical protein